MRALSIRQPWAWLILHAGKDIENRDWATAYRGEVLIHAGKACTEAEYEDAVDFAIACGADLRAMPSLASIPRGGIVGRVEIVDCVQDSASPWFVGEHGFVLRNAKPLPYLPWRGQLNFFDVPRSAVAGADGSTW